MLSLERLSRLKPLCFCIEQHLSEKQPARVPDVLIVSLIKNPNINP